MTAAKDTELDTLLDGIDHLSVTQQRHGEILTHLEQRPIPDLEGLARRLEDVADAVERLQPPPAPSRRWLQWVLPGMLLVGLLIGWCSCWLTVRWLPSTMLPPGFTRPGPPAAKGRY